MYLFIAKIACLIPKLTDCLNPLLSLSSLPDGGSKGEAEGDGEDDLQEAQPLGGGRPRRKDAARIVKCGGGSDEKK